MHIILEVPCAYAVLAVLLWRDEALDRAEVRVAALVRRRHEREVAAHLQAQRQHRSTHGEGVPNAAKTVLWQQNASAKLLIFLNSST